MRRKNPDQRIVYGLVIEPNADLRGVNLEKADLRGADLQGAHLEGAILDHAKLDGANLAGAHLENARLYRTQLIDTNLEGAHLEDAYLSNANLMRTNLEGAHLQRARINNATIGHSNFKGAKLQGAIIKDLAFVECDLTDADFSETELYSVEFRLFSKLDGAIFENATIDFYVNFPTDFDARKYFPKYYSNRYLRGADFRGADLKEANFNNADLTGARFEGADLTYAWMKNANLKNAHLEGAILVDTRLMEANLEGAHLEEANLEGAWLNGAKLEGAHIENANFKSVTMQGVNLSGLNLSGIDLDNSDLSDSEFNNTNLEDAILSNCSLHRTQFIEAILINADLSNSVLGGTKLQGAKLIKANLDGASLSFANLEGADLTDAHLIGATFYGVDARRLEGTNFTNADLSNAKLEETDLSRAILTDANLTNINIDKNVKLPENFDIRRFMPIVQYSRSYGEMTGAVLKLGKPDSPPRAADFKRKYPSEFDRLIKDTGGKDFTDSVKEDIRSKYRTPFDWYVTRRKYYGGQRLAEFENDVILLNIDLEKLDATPKQFELVKRLAEVSRKSEHPYANYPLFTIGWVRFDTNEARKVYLVEEVQSDVWVVRQQTKNVDAQTQRQLDDAGIAPEDFDELFEVLRPYAERFYEDALGILFMEAEEKGYSVEMLGYGDKKKYGSPRSIYTDLPRKMGMRPQPTQTDFNLQDKVSYYKPNPSRPRRRY